MRDCSYPDGVTILSLISLGFMHLNCVAAGREPSLRRARAGKVSTARPSIFSWSTWITQEPRSAKVARGTLQRRTNRHTSGGLGQRSGFASSAQVSSAMCARWTRRGGQVRVCGGDVSLVDALGRIRERTFNVNSFLKRIPMAEVGKGRAV